MIVSGSGTIDPEAEIFRHRFSPIIVLTTRSVPKRRIERLRQVSAEVAMFGETKLDFVAALRWLREKWNVKRLLCEGGGELNDGLLRAGVVDEIYVTLCPLILGGRCARGDFVGHWFLLFPLPFVLRETDPRVDERVGHVDYQIDAHNDHGRVG